MALSTADAQHPILRSMQAAGGTAINQIKMPLLNSSWQLSQSVTTSIDADKQAIL